MNTNSCMVVHGTLGGSRIRGGPRIGCTRVHRTPGLIISLKFRRPRPLTRIKMLTTVHLSTTETLNYTTERAALRAFAHQTAWKRGSRFVQLVGSDGRILDIIEISLAPRA